MELACCNEDLVLNKLIGLSIRLDRLLRECRWLPKQPQLLLNPPLDIMPELMQISNPHLSTSEHCSRIELDVCLYCGEEGHVLSSCPVRPVHPCDRGVLLNGTTSQDRVGTASHLISAKPFLVPVTLSLGNMSVVSALLDSILLVHRLPALFTCLFFNCQIPSLSMRWMTALGERE